MSFLIKKKVNAHANLYHSYWDPSVGIYLAFNQVWLPTTWFRTSRNSRESHTTQCDLNYINASTSCNLCEWNEISITENPNQTMCISELYAKHLNLYMTNRIIIYRHKFTKVFDKIVNKTMITSTFWIDCFFTLTLCINASTRRKITSSAVIFNKYYCKINFYLNNITQITSHRKLRWRDMIDTHFYSYNY